MLEVRDLHAFYGKSHVLHGVSLDVREGEIVCLLGRNGVGRSTTTAVVTASIIVIIADFFLAKALQVILGTTT